MSDAATSEPEITIGAPPGLAPASEQGSGGSKMIALAFAIAAAIATLAFAVLLGTMWIDWSYF